MLYKLVSPPAVEEHGENIIHLFVRDANGAPVPNARLKVWAGPPPTGSPAYWNDDFPFRNPNASGMLEFVAVTGPMPDTRDYWIQAIANDGTPQSDPVQFHFPQGSTIWITATLQPEGATSGPTQPDAGASAPIAVQWDARLTAMNISIAPVPALAPGQRYWKIIAAQYQDEQEAGGNHNVYYSALNQNGNPMAGVLVQMDWQGREPNDVPSQSYTDGNGTANYPLYAGPVGWKPQEGPGPYAAWLGDPDLRGRTPTQIPGEKFVGAGLPMNRHVNFIVTWKQVVAASPADTVSPEPDTVTSPEPTPDTATPAPATYTVQRGDTLSAIARKFDVTVAALVAANDIANPNQIRTGQVLTIPGVASENPPPTPPAPSTTTYTVQRGDTLSAIARKFGVSVAAIVAANNIANANLIKPAQVLTIPSAAPVPPKPVEPSEPTVPEWYTPLPPATRPAGALPLNQFPRPRDDNGRGIHFGLDVSQKSLDAHVPHMVEMGIKWVLMYPGDELQAEKCAVAAWNAGIMPVLRPKCRIDGGQPNWLAFVQACKKHDIPAYIQIYNEPGDDREWNHKPADNDLPRIFASKWANAASLIYDAGGFPGLQILGQEELVAAANTLQANNQTHIWNRAFFALHNYGLNHPPAYPYDERNQQDHPQATILDDDACVLGLIEFAKWMYDAIGFVLPMIGGEGGWLYDAGEDNRYPKTVQPYHAQWHVEMYDWFRHGRLSNGQPLPDYVFSVAPWILSGFLEAEAWYGGPLGDKTETINAVKAMTPFVRK